jgi:putrescine transport system substrate-binding protein
MKHGLFLIFRCVLFIAIGLISSVNNAMAEEEKVLNIYNWVDYIADDTIANFEKETGIKVRYDIYDTNEIWHSKLLGGRSGYDLVIPSSNWARIQMEARAFQPLNKSLLGNYNNLDKSVQQILSTIDPGNDYLVSWLWGFTTIGINTVKVKEALGGLPMPANLWDLLFDPTYSSKLQTCGISVLDSASELIPATLVAIGRDAFSRKPSDYQDAENALKKIRKNITIFSNNGYIDDLANGRICLAMGYSGDLNRAKVRAIERKNGNQIEVLLPKSGGVLFFDMMAIPADAAHPTNAHLFINYILRPEVHASLTNKLLYANANKESRRLIRPDVLSSKTVFLPAYEMVKMQAPRPLNNDMRRRINTIYNNFKLGF